MLLISCHIRFSSIYCTCSYTILSYDFHILCFSYTVLSYVFHILYLSFTFRVMILYFLYLNTCHFLLDFMSAKTLEADTGNNYMYP